MHYFSDKAWYSTVSHSVNPTPRPRPHARSDAPPPLHEPGPQPGRLHSPRGPSELLSVRRLCCRPVFSVLLLQCVLCVLSTGFSPLCSFLSLSLLMSSAAFHPYPLYLSQPLYLCLPIHQPCPLLYASSPSPPLCLSLLSFSHSLCPSLFRSLHVSLSFFLSMSLFLSLYLKEFSLHLSSVNSECNSA